MEDSVIKLLETGSEDDIIRLLQEFNVKVWLQYLSMLYIDCLFAFFSLKIILDQLDWAKMHLKEYGSLFLCFSMIKILMKMVTWCALKHLEF